MLNFLKEEDLLVLVFSIAKSTWLKEVFNNEFKKVGAITIYKDSNTCMIYNRKWINIGDAIYRKGYWSASDNFNIVVHEYWHGILNYISAINKNSKNKKIYNDRKSESGKMYKNAFDLYDDLKKDNKMNKKTGLNKKTLFDDYYAYMYNNVEIKKTNDINSYTLINMVAVPSLYAREDLREELMCEAFTYWYLTPISERNYYWEIIHNYFNKEFFERSNYTLFDYM